MAFEQVIKILSWECFKCKQYSSFQFFFFKCLDLSESPDALPSEGSPASCEWIGAPPAALPRQRMRKRFQECSLYAGLEFPAAQSAASFG